MSLALEQIQEAIRKPNKRNVIDEAKQMQRRIRFHSETNTSPYTLSGRRASDFNLSADLFLEWVSKLLPKDKFNTFLHLFRFPLSTPAVVEDVYRELERVFYSRNASSTYQFNNSEAEEDWQHYRQQVLHEPEIWKTVGWQKMKVSPNSILIVDLPEIQATDRPAPYFYWLEIDDVIDYSTKNAVDIDWIIFNQPLNRVAVFDEERIRVFQLNEKKEIEGPVIVDNPHGLGYCPARFFWLPGINEAKKEIKKNPITKELSNLDWYLFFSLSKRHLDLYAPYPIYSAYEADCNFENSETGDYCDGGYLRNADGHYKMLADGSIEQCPCCSKKRVAGPGTLIEIPIPNAQEGQADLRSPVQITTIDKNSLEYNVSECERIKDEIIVSVVGSGGTVSEKEAINETQVSANFESKTSVLNSLKTNFESAQTFVEDTICRLRYGDEFISSSINWGTEFYVFTVQELYKKYADAKKAGASEFELNSIAEQILEVEYRNNLAQLSRMYLLRQLEPYPNCTKAEIMQLVQNGLVNLEKVKIKLNFSTYIERFERENTNILEFAKNKTTREKIDIIYQTLVKYAEHERTIPAAIGGSQGWSGANQKQEGGASKPEGGD
jgi:hypothetical protein